MRKQQLPPSFSKSGNSVLRGEKDFTQNAKEAGDQQSGTRSRTNRRQPRTLIPGSLPVLVWTAVAALARRRI